MREHRGMRLLESALVLSILSAPDVFAADPKFQFAKPEEVKGVEWSVQSRAGLNLSTGNSRSTSLAAGISASRKANENRFSGEGSVAYVRSAVLLANDADGSGFIDPGELSRVTQTTSQSWLVQGRYDRFFKELNSVFLSARASSDKPAGKELIGGGQLGYSRQLYASDQSETAVEAGYDFQYEKYESTPVGASVHSARVAVIHATQISDSSLIKVNLEALTNLNTETAPNPEGGTTVDPLDDWRLGADVSVTTALTRRISFGLTWKMRYDHVPAPRPPLGLPYAEGFTPFADRLDNTVEASLILTLL